MRLPELKFYRRDKPYHFLVGGTTGSGKSEFLRSLLLSLLYRHSPQHLKIALVDPKRVTFPEFEKMPWLYSPVVKDSDRAIALMEQLVAEMESRYQQFEKAGCADLSAYNHRSSKPLPRIVCIEENKQQQLIFWVKAIYSTKLALNNTVYKAY